GDNAQRAQGGVGDGGGLLPPGEMLMGILSDRLGRHDILPPCEREVVQSLPHMIGSADGTPSRRPPGAVPPVPGTRAGCFPRLPRLPDRQPQPRPVPRASTSSHFLDADAYFARVGAAMGPEDVFLTSAE